MSAGPSTTPARPGFALGTFVRSAGVLSISAIASFIRALVTAKLLAISLGPTLVGVLSQLLNFSALATTVIALGLSTGVVKSVAETAAVDRRRVGMVAGTASAVSFASGLAAAVLLAPFSGAISSALTGTSRYGLLVFLVLLSFPLYNVAAVLAYVIQGLSDVALLTWGNVATAIASLATLIPLTLAYGITGAIESVLAVAVIQLALFAWALTLAFRRRGVSLAWLRQWDGAEARVLLGYGGIVLVGGVATWGALLAVRTLLVRTQGGYENGLYQVAYGLSNQYVTIFMTWMSAYVFPRIAAERNAGHLRPLLNSGLRANLLLMVPVIGCTLALRTPLIHLLYSAAFVPAASLVPLQALGDYLRVIGWSFGVALFARGHTRAHLLVIAVQSAAWVAAAAALLPLAGVYAAPLGYVISLVAYPLLAVPMAHRWFGGGLDADSAVASLAGLAAIVAAWLLPPAVGVLVSLAVPAAIIVRERYRPAPAPR